MTRIVATIDAAGAREGLEGVFRCCARLSILPHDRIVYLRCKPRRIGATHLVMMPLQFP